MIIEFIGSTGAGKTTLMKEVHHRLIKSADVTTSFELIATPLGLHSVSNKIARNFIQEVVVLPVFLRSLYKNKSIVGFVLRMLGRQPKLSIYTLNNLRGIERKIGVYEKIKRYTHNRIILVDEGTVHLAHKVFVFTSAVYTPNEISKFARLIPKPDLIIYIKAPIETLVQRTLQRADPPREIKNNRLLTENFIIRACSIFDQIIQDENLKNRVLIVENPESSGKGFENAADHIVQTILNLEANEEQAQGINQ